MDESSGFQIGSVMKIWTSLYAADMLNIIHIHVNEGSDSVAIDVRYLQDHDYQHKSGQLNEGVMRGFDFSKEEFKNDELTGEKLRYKVLIKDQQVFAVLYNTGNSVERI